MHANEAKPPPYFDYGTTIPKVHAQYRVHVPEWDNGRNVLYANVQGSWRPAVGYARPTFALCGGWLGPLLNQIPTPHRAVSRFNWDLRDMPTAEFHAPFHLGRPWPTDDIFIFSQWGISRLFTLDCTGRRHEDSKTQLWRFQMLIAEDRAPHATVLALGFVGAPAMYSPHSVAAT